ncbi:MAG: [FeFe] hydrogenase H-cluster radical SAM maturase HydE [Patescibacteria group bacterium]
MCLTLPAKVVKVKGLQAEILASGAKQVVKIGTAAKIRAGDWVLYTNNFLIKKISQTEAEEISALLGSYQGVTEAKLEKKLKDILTASSVRDLNVEEIEYLLGVDGQISQAALFSQANVARKANIKDHICIHGIIEFSNHCQNDCLYCGLRRSNDKVSRYRLSPEKIIKIAVAAVNNRGYKILVLQSGEDDYYSDGKIELIIKEIKKQARVFIYLSIGDRSEAAYKKFKVAGASGVLYRFETSNPDIYVSLHPGDSLEKRLENLEMMRNLGYALSSGPLIGLPAQTLKDLASDITLMKKLGVFMPSMGPLIPSAETPLAGEKKIDFGLVLKMIAASRLVMPKARIPVTTAMETLARGEGISIDEARQKCFMAGANSVMLNLTPETQRQKYYIYENKFFDVEKKYENWGLFKGELSYRMLEEELRVSI